MADEPILPPPAFGVPPLLGETPPGLGAGPPRHDSAYWRDLLIALGIIWSFDVMLGLAAFFAPDRKTTELNPSALLVTTLLSNVFGFGVAWMFVCKKYRKGFADGFALVKVSSKATWMSVAVGMAGAVVATLLLARFSTGESMMAKLVSAPGGLTAVTIVALTVPPFEELYYRGFIFPVLRKAIGATWSIVAVSAWFGGVHSFQLAGDWIGVPVIVVMGAIWTWQRHRFGSLLPAMVCHWTYNSCLMLIHFLGPVD